MPAPLSGKKRENDVLFKTANLHEDANNRVRYAFLFVVPYSNFILSLFSKKWKEYRTLRKKGYYLHENRKIEVIAVPSFRSDYLVKRFLVNICFNFYRKRLKSTIVKNHIDLVHAHNVGTDAALAAKINARYKIPYVITTRNIHNNRITSYVRKNLSMAKLLISLTPTLKRIADNFNENSILIPHGIDDVFFSHPSKGANISGKLKVVTICRLLNWKNIDKVLCALEKADFDFNYDIYGDGPDEERLKKMVDSLSIKNKVAFKGYTNYASIPSILGQYDVFVLVSYPETFGRIYIESMAVGVPVIAAKGCGMDGFVADGKEGFLIDHENVDSILNVLTHIAENRAILTNISQHSRLLARHFIWSNVIRKINDSYLKAIKWQTF